MQWIKDQNNCGRCLTGDVITANTTQLLQEGNDLVPEASRLEFKFPSDWPCHFQRRWILKSQMLQSKASDANEQTVEGYLPELRAECYRFAKEDV